MNLKFDGFQWVVTFAESGKVTHRKFLSIDPACDFLVDNLKVDDGEVDAAVINLHVLNHKVAMFDNGQFSHTEAK